MIKKRQILENLVKVSLFSYECLTILGSWKIVRMAILKYFKNKQCVLCVVERKGMKAILQDRDEESRADRCPEDRLGPVLG